MGYTNSCLQGGAVLGAVGGLGLGLWLTADFIDPALSQDGMSETGAAVFSTTIAFCCLLPVFIGLGASSGALILGSLGKCLEMCESGQCQSSPPSTPPPNERTRLIQQGLTHAHWSNSGRFGDAKPVVENGLEGLAGSSVELSSYEPWTKSAV